MHLYVGWSSENCTNAPTIRPAAHTQASSGERFKVAQVSASSGGHFRWPRSVNGETCAILPPCSSPEHSNSRATLPELTELLANRFHLVAAAAAATNDSSR